MYKDNDTRAITVAVARAPGAPFSIEPARIRAPRNDEVRVRVVATGMCHTDLIVRDQYYPVPLPAVLGHEGAGVVEAVGPNVKTLTVGDHVVLTYGACGYCHICVGGHGAYCQHFFTLNFGGGDTDGQTALQDDSGQPLHDHFFAQSSFASYAIARENNAIKVPKEAPLELLGPLGCGIQTGAGAVIHSLAVRPGSSFASFGAGAVGMSAVLAARIAGATTIIAIDIVPSRLELAKALGATHVINSKEVDVVDAIRAITGGGVDFALESTGLAAVLSQGIEALGTRGTMGVVGAPRLGTKAEFDVNNLLLGGRTIRGIVEGDSVPQTFIPQLVQLHLQGRFPFDRLVKFYSLEQINQAAEDSSSGITLKPILRLSH
ncbi:TPA: NAD(P)-dependent alcohol dehydrogenase [Burkholderia vietnamiensis]|uniref:NAD(P)-dependent alcohol dehydrogenase n=1 Tax=Burkholderia vietnamiensis TaxID=60552 RepID=UPI00264BFE77|nr:NAD(P)-dependent alcohol dehydrogenase [Burkholderia vietnamiensis]MDN8071212.1 NAD(P)-dependent alcohol dehydrogenase [Burkholderia vietnamiensis]HDR9095739.1 NAD(P)-dependent alcohol dehydrogenase [Burkholderia vietnamiensis]HDR9319238.1 NAD(P)-dependent alcohol dehydrogenase [Burkholderia vietnamiensis]